MSSFNCNCKTCRLEKLSVDEIPCSMCDGTEYWEPKNFGAACTKFFNDHSGPATDEESDCTKCQHEPCKDCGINEQNYFEPKEEKEEKKMHDVKIMEAKEVIPETPRVSYLGQTALNTLVDIYTKLGMIEDFIDAPTESYPSLGNLGCPDNLIHNLKQINEIANVINQRLDRLQEKL